MIYKSQTPGYLQEPHFFIAISFKTVFLSCLDLGLYHLQEKSEESQINSLSKPFSQGQLGGLLHDGAWVSPQWCPGTTSQLLHSCSVFGSGGPHVASHRHICHQGDMTQLSQATPVLWHHSKVIYAVFCIWPQWDIWIKHISNLTLQPL